MLGRHGRRVLLALMAVTVSGCGVGSGSLPDKLSMSSVRQSSPQSYPRVVNLSVGSLGPALEGQVEALQFGPKRLQAVVRWTNLPDAASYVTWNQSQSRLTSQAIPGFLSAACASSQTLWWSAVNGADLTFRSDTGYRQSWAIPAGVSPSRFFYVRSSHEILALVRAKSRNWGVLTLAAGHSRLVWLPPIPGQITQVAFGSGGGLWIAESSPNRLLYWTGSRFVKVSVPGPITGLAVTASRAFMLINSGAVSSGTANVLGEANRQGQIIRVATLVEPHRVSSSDALPWYGGGTNVSWVGPHLLMIPLWDSASNMLALSTYNTLKHQFSLIPGARFASSLGSAQKPKFPVSPPWHHIIAMGNGGNVTWYVPTPLALNHLVSFMK